MPNHNQPRGGRTFSLAETHVRLVGRTGLICTVRLLVDPPGAGGAQRCSHGVSVDLPGLDIAPCLEQVPGIHKSSSCIGQRFQIIIIGYGNVPGRGWFSPPGIHDVPYG